MKEELSQEQKLAKAEQYVQSKAWNYRTNDNQIIVEYCPIMGCDNWHFYLGAGREADVVWDCKKCGRSGTLFQLREHLGDKDQPIESTKDWANKKQAPDPLPDPNAAHQKLRADEAAMDYLQEQRGFTLQTIIDAKLGLMEQRGIRYLLIPYISKNRIVYAKYRTLPPEEKRFIGSKGRENPLYNEDIITEGIEELWMVEGEMDALAMINAGVKNVVGIPGANNKKALWITRLDNAAPKRIYMLYDNDHVGQTAAEEMARRIALNMNLPVPMNVNLPEFEKEDGTPGKDINEWFKAGHTVEELEELKAEAMPFEVRGVVSLAEALDELENELQEKEELKPTYVTPWEDLNFKLAGFEPGDVCDIISREKVGKTTMSLNLIDYLVAQYQENGLFICLEMQTKRLARKLVSYLAQVDDSPAKSTAEAKQKLENMKAGILVAKEALAGRSADLMLSNPKFNTGDECLDMIRQAVRRYAVKFVVLDNVQALADATLKRLEHRTIYISQLSKKSKQLATELGIVLFRLVQPNKAGFRGQIVDHRDADGSSQLGKDCDVSIALHRNSKAELKEEDFATIGYMDEEQAMDSNMLTRVSISRYAAGGVCTLKIEGGLSTVRELTPAEKGDATSKVAAANGPVSMPVGMNQEAVEAQP